MPVTNIRPYTKAGSFESLLQTGLPRIMHGFLFLAAGIFGLATAFLLNAFLVIYWNWPLAIAYAIVLPVQFGLNFYVLRQFVFGGTQSSSKEQLKRYLPRVTLLRIADWATYTCVVTLLPVPFWLAQALNLVLFSILRYQLARNIFNDNLELSSEAETQDGIVIGNITNKASLSNPLAQTLVTHFDRCLSDLIKAARPTDIHEIGCGEGRLAELIVNKFKLPYRGCDFSSRMIEIAQTKPLKDAHFKQQNIYDLTPSDSADTVICCEVLEHLEDPERGLIALRSLKARQYILSVPREPIWRILNLARLKYVPLIGNTPGHLNHWSSRAFIQLLKDHGFVVEKINSPFPWTMLRGHFDTNNDAR